jgi:membrane-bound lytic murein transglycosylase A
MLCLQLAAFVFSAKALAQIRPEDATSSKRREPIPISALPGFATDDLQKLDEAIDSQCALKVPPLAWITLCKEFSTERGNLQQWISQRFQAWPLLNMKGTAEGLITGYYEPIITGSRVREHNLQVPLYKKPSDLQRSRSASSVYYSRAEIENTGILAGEELIWVDDPVDAFFLQIQGSGRVELRERTQIATTIRVGYADNNGHPYKAIGQVLIERGALKLAEINAESIKKWLRENQDDAKTVMQSNPRFIFFTELPEGRKDLGPMGALAVPLTQERSIASDPKTIPLGTLLFLDTSHPVSGQPLQKVVISQDVGAAISGAVRADYFWGTGLEAERSASAMKQSGRLWILWPLDLLPPE